MNATVKVYLNRGEDLFRKFNPDTAQLRLAVSAVLVAPFGCFDKVAADVKLLPHHVQQGRDGLLAVGQGKVKANG